MHRHILRLIAVGLVSVLVACSDATGTDEALPKSTAKKAQPRASTDGTSESPKATQVQHVLTERWYSGEQVERGKALFSKHCAACHGAQGQGAFNWRQRDASGTLPAPPLNGTGHAWHHPLQGLGYQIKFGAPGGSGSMPPFKDTLTDTQIVDTIAWFQSHWNDEIYKAWMQRQRPKR